MYINNVVINVENWVNGADDIVKPPDLPVYCLRLDWHLTCSNGKITLRTYIQMKVFIDFRTD